MPGSKTFTSIKSHELFEYNLIRDMEAISNDSINKFCKKIVVEFFKLIFSASITTIISSGTELFLKLKNASDITDMLLYAANILGVFICAYFILQLLIYLIKSISNLFFNNRRFKRVQKRDKRKFDLYIANTIMSGVSFENKLRYYYNEFLKEISNNPFEIVVSSCHALDLIMGYLLGCVEALEQSDNDLKKLLPERMSGLREKANKCYMEYIGTDAILSYINISLHTLKRLRSSIEKINSLPNLKHDEFNLLLNRRLVQTDKLIGHYDTHKCRALEFINIPANNKT